MLCWCFAEAGGGRAEPIVRWSLEMDLDFFETDQIWFCVKDGGRVALTGRGDVFAVRNQNTTIPINSIRLAFC